METMLKRFWRFCRLRVSLCSRASLTVRNRKGAVRSLLFIISTLYYYYFMIVLCQFFAKRRKRNCINSFSMLEKNAELWAESSRSSVVYPMLEWKAGVWSEPPRFRVVYPKWGRRPYRRFECAIDSIHWVWQELLVPANIGNIFWHQSK